MGSELFTKELSLVKDMFKALVEVPPALIDNRDAPLFAQASRSLLNTVQDKLQHVQQHLAVDDHASTKLTKAIDLYISTNEQGADKISMNGCDVDEWAAALANSLKN